MEEYLEYQYNVESVKLIKSETISMSCSACCNSFSRLHSMTNTVTNKIQMLCCMCKIVCDYVNSNKSVNMISSLRNSLPKMVLVKSEYDQSEIIDETYEWIISNDNVPFITDIDPSAKIVKTNYIDYAISYGKDNHNEEENNEEYEYEYGDTVYEYAYEEDSNDGKDNEEDNGEDNEENKIKIMFTNLLDITPMQNNPIVIKNRFTAKSNKGKKKKRKKCNNIYSFHGKVIDLM